MTVTDKKPVNQADVQTICTIYVDTNGNCHRKEKCHYLHVANIEEHVRLRDKQVAAGEEKAQQRTCIHGNDCVKMRRHTCIFSHQKSVYDVAKPSVNIKYNIITPRVPTAVSPWTKDVVRPDLEKTVQDGLQKERTEALALKKIAKEDALRKVMLRFVDLAENTVLPDLVCSAQRFDDIWSPTAADIINLVSDPKVSVAKMIEVESNHKSAYRRAISSAGFEGWSMIFYAVKHQRQDLVAHFLRQRSVSPDVLGGPGLPLLAFAIFSDYTPEGTEMLRLILSFSADASVFPSPLFTPFVDPLGLAAEASDLPLWFSCARSQWEKKLKTKFYLVQRYFLDVASTSVVSPRVRQVSPLLGHQALFGASFLIIGQRIATDALRQAFLTHATGTDQDLPLVLLLAGPSGHGKTELARNLARLMNAEDRFICMPDMGSVTDLLGAKAVGAWANSEKGAELEHFLVAHHGKRGVVILDELEKVGDMDVLNSLLAIWESGMYTSRRGEAPIDASKIIWIATTNGADAFISQFCETGIYREAFRTGKVNQSVAEELQRGTVKTLMGVFSKPVMGRIHDVIPFTPFSEDERAVIVSDLALRLKRHVARPVCLLEPNINTVGDANIEFIQDEVAICRDIASLYESDTGARSLKRAAKKALEFTHSKAYFAHQEAIVEGGRLELYKIKHSEAKGVQVFYVPKGEESGEESDEDEDDEGSADLYD